GDLPDRHPLSRSGVSRHGQVAEGRVPGFDRSGRLGSGTAGMGGGDRRHRCHPRRLQAEEESETMTFSIAARCVDTGMLGIAVSSSSPAVAARCAYARAGIGAVGTQNITDPRLGPAGLDLMVQGASAEQAIATLKQST